MAVISQKTFLYKGLLHPVFLLLFRSLLSSFRALKGLSQSLRGSTTIISAEQFHSFLYRNRSLLSPVITLQHKLRSLILGTEFWKRQTRNRYEICDGSYIPFTRLLKQIREGRRDRTRRASLLALTFHMRSSPSVVSTTVVTGSAAPRGGGEAHLFPPHTDSLNGSLHEGPATSVPPLVLPLGSLSSAETFPLEDLVSTPPQPPPSASAQGTLWSRRRLFSWKTPQTSPEEIVSVDPSSAHHVSWDISLTDLPPSHGPNEHPSIKEEPELVKQVSRSLSGVLSSKETQYDTPLRIFHFLMHPLSQGGC
jgi:hypothetical protein